MYNYCQPDSPFTLSRLKGSLDCHLKYSLALSKGKKWTKLMAKVEFSQISAKPLKIPKGSLVIH